MVIALATLTRSDANDFVVFLDAAYSNTGLGLFVLEDLHVGQAACVVDGHVAELPAEGGICALCPGPWPE